MDPFTLTVWYFLISCGLFIFEGGFLYGLLVSEVFLVYCLRNYDDCAIPLGAVMLYVVIWFIVVSCVYAFWLAFLLFLGYCLIFVLPVVLWLHFH